jgi:hypothetical protein
MRALEIARFLLPLFSVLLTHGQSAENGLVAVGVVTSFGEPLPGGEIRIDGHRAHKVVTIKGRTVVSLPYGTYHVTSDPTAHYWPSERIFDVLTPRLFLLIALAPKEAFAIFGEGTATPYRVVGTVARDRPRTSTLFARLRGLYLSCSAEAEVDRKGNFELAVPLQGSYSVEILEGELITAAKPIRLDETTRRPVRVDFLIP